MAEGDPRVLFVMNLVLSSIFASAVIWGLDFIDVVAFTPWNVASLALLLMALTYAVTR
jgi:hypothetical protein